MNAEAIRIAIAEACGHEPELTWHVLSPDGKGSCLSGEKHKMEAWLADMQSRYPQSLYATYHVGAWKHYKHYDEDLNAMHEVEKVLTREQQDDYANHLYPMLPCDENHGPCGAGDEDIVTASMFQVMHATADKRAEAFLKTLNLWKP